MSTTQNALASKVYETWAPKLQAKFAANGRKVSESKLRTLSKMSHVRKVWENSQATLANTPGRGGVAFGNNPNAGTPGFYADGSKGSADVFGNLFGVFVEVAAFNIGMELLPNLPMNKSTGQIVIAEPIYANGRIDSGEKKPEVFQVKATKTGSVPALVEGQTYSITAGFGGATIMTVGFIGRHRLNGNLMLRIVTTAAPYATATVAECLDSATNQAGIYTSAGVRYNFDGGIDYVAGFTNVITGFSGAGAQNNDAWTANRGNGSHYGQPMTRAVGERANYKSMGVRIWNKNFAAETIHVDVEYTTEQVQDYQMDHGMNALEFGQTIMEDQLNQHLNEHILGSMFSMGWDHHSIMNTTNGFNMNAFIAAASSTGAAKTFLGHDGTLKTIAGVPGVLPATGAISENLSTLQRRIVTRLLYGSGIINHRSRRGKGDQCVANTTFATALKDVRGFTMAPFANDINDSGLYQYGSLYGIRLYEDPLMNLTDERINISRHGNEQDPGLKFCPYLLAEKISTIAEQTMAPKEALKSRYALVPAGSNPETNYLTFTVETDGGYAIV